ncbi:glycosyltransferase family 2 protein [Mycobacterium sp. MS1601]|uniref:glycosyltransferase family 2 protein n=1 Tax=Mycobacterium sp. MS1601 TaxID=1936029 RepID=UPI0012FCB3F1|nr:glycosyltransferase [Mycobacterium sp. MS1601]
MSEPLAVETRPATTLTVVICCFTDRRRNQTIAAAEAALHQLLPDDDVVIVVDHNAALLADLTVTLDSRITVLSNTFERGLSGGRNTGLHWAPGEVVVFLDDDAVLHDGSLERIREVFAGDTVVAVGGGVEPDWQTGAAPGWFPPEFGWVVGCDYRGLPADGAPIRNPIGAAMAVRKDALALINGFSPELGRVGTLPAGCEETLMGVALGREFPHLQIIRDTGFRVAHHIPSDRMTFTYFVRRCYHEGASKAVLSRISGPQAALSSERAYTTRILPSGLWRARSNPRRAAALVAGFAATAVGFIVGTAQQVWARRTGRDTPR